MRRERDDNPLTEWILHKRVNDDPNQSRIIYQVRRNNMCRDTEVGERKMICTPYIHIMLQYHADDMLFLFRSGVRLVS